MKPLQKKLQNYLKTVSGEEPRLKQATDSPLPLYLRERYTLLNSRIFGRPYLLALAKQSDASPGEYQTDAVKIGRELNDSVVLIIESLSSYDRNRLVQHGVPFIVPGSQTFIPMVFIDLRERQPAPKQASTEKLTPAAQCVILQHLQKSRLDKISMNFLASKVGYSPIMMSKVKLQLETLGLAKSYREGKTVVLRFTSEGKGLWEKALPYLRSPVKKRYWVQWKMPQYPALLAGISALSRRSILSEDSIPSYALWSKTFQKNLEKGLYHGCRSADEADVQIEAWSYNPLTTSDSDDVVDKLSLYLSLRDNPDERVQQQLEKLIHDMPW